MSNGRTVFAIYLETTRKKLTEGLAGIHRIIDQTFPTLSSEILVVDNAITTPHEEKLEDGATLIDGDNSCREFSGIDRGLAWLQKNRPLRADSVFLLANDTFSADPDVEDFFNMDSRKILHDLDRNCLIGSLLWSPLPLELFGVTTDRWIQSNMIMCNYSVLQHITPLALPAFDNEIFSDNPAEFFNRDAPLSSEYKHYIRCYLQGRLNVTLCKWHSAAEFNADNFGPLKLKAKAILCEHYLSANARKNGFELKDLTGPRLPSKEMRVRIKVWLWYTGVWRLIPRYGRRFGAWGHSSSPQSAFTSPASQECKSTNSR